jgi:hypothetical protein
MRQYSGWQALFLSFFSPSLYRDVAKEWHGLGYVYLFLLVCLSIFFMALQTQVVAVPRAQQIVDSIISQMPSVTIDKGKLSIDKPSPYVLTEPKSDRAIITFDTRPKPMTFEESKCVFLVTSDAVYGRKQSTGTSGADRNRNPSALAEGGTVEKFSLSTIDHFTLDMNSGKQVVNSFFQWLGTIIFFVWVPFGFAFCVVQTLLYALVGKAFSKMVEVNLTYGTLVRLAAVALTPVLLLDSLQKVASVNIPHWPWVSLFLALGYLYFAVYSNSQVQPVPTTSTAGEQGPG